ncbi:MAG: hypothetical protein ABIQ38_01235 [Ilumatobacteraceae bacterium]
MNKHQSASRRICVLTGAALITLAACSTPARTATNFCRQLQHELPEIAQPTATPGEVSTLVGSYERLGKVAPLTIEEDWKALTNLVKAAAEVDATDPASVQAVADLSYATQKSATAAAKWVTETCGVDISTGISITP